MLKINPYTPGAGRMPQYLAGRDEIIDSVSNMYDCMLNGIVGQSIVLTGLRGVGKTVLINKLYSIAEEKGIYCKHIEVERENDFLGQIDSCIKTYLQKHSKKNAIKNIFEKAIDTLKSFQISFCPEDNTFSLSAQERFLLQSTNLSQSLTDLFCSVGEIAKNTQSPICLFVDEMQCMKEKELGSLISAIHRVNQLGYPIIIIAAGLPKLYKMLSDERSYSERLFYYEEIGSLTYEQSKNAISEPIKSFNVTYTEEALQKIYFVTKGYPFFIQQFCNVIYDITNEKLITRKNVESSIDRFFELLDKGFFKSRYEKCSQGEKIFIFAMAECNELPCTISNIAKKLNKSTKSISPIRGTLMNKGIVYSVRYSELDFTVPEFDVYIKRQDEYKQWLLEK